jgi:hypothetical protein
MEISSLVHILSPFVGTLWFVVVSAIMVLTLLLSATWYLRPQSDVAAGSASYTCCDSLLSVFGSFCQQGVQYAPRHSFMLLQSKSHYDRQSVGQGPPLWSSGQSSWLQIRRPGFNSRHYQKKEVVGLERGPLSLVSTTEELLDRKVAAPV